MFSEIAELSALLRGLSVRTHPIGFCLSPTISGLQAALWADKEEAEILCYMKRKVM